MRWLLVFISFLFFATTARADCVPEPGGVCLSASQFQEVKKALLELDSIHKSPAIIATNDKITIIHDWNGRVYVNGGETKPLRYKLKLGDTIDRDLVVKLDTQVHYRPKPPDPMFRLRIRAQLGILLPELSKTFEGEWEDFVDAGLGWDFFHYKLINFAAYTGIRSAGVGAGFDVTKNFGPYIGYSFIYDGFRSSVMFGSYMAFN